MNKHTQGPWKSYIENKEVFIESTDQRLIAKCGITICKESKANARLIAAAPKLLKVLENIENWMVNHVERKKTAGYDCELASIRAAIAKAKGETK